MNETTADYKAQYTQQYMFTQQSSMTLYYIHLQLLLVTMQYITKLSNAKQTQVKILTAHWVGKGVLHLVVSIVGRYTITYNRSDVSERL